MQIIKGTMRVVLAGYWTRLGKGDYVKTMWIHYYRVTMKRNKRTRQQLRREWALEDKRV